MRFLVAFVLGIFVALAIELAYDSSGTVRVLASIGRPAWIIIAIVALAAVLGLAYESEERREEEKKPWYLRDH